MDLVQHKMASKIGDLFLVASEKGLKGIYWKKQPSGLMSSLKRTSAADKILVDTERQLNEYFFGKRKVFDISFDLEGTDFQQTVWQALLSIPFGQTVSYANIAKKIKNPKAVRAVGSANGKNPVCIIIPCHRVIASDGSIGGYAGGIDIKEKLLTHEMSF